MSVSAGANPPSADSANTGPDTCTSDAPDSSDAAYAADSSDTADSSDAADAGSNAPYAGSNASGDATGNGERNAAGRDSANQQTFHYDSHVYLRRTSPVGKRCLSKPYYFRFINDIVQIPTHRVGAATGRHQRPAATWHTGR